jgi:unsaturated chondroitin disaccharide hydrolase
VTAPELTRAERDRAIDDLVDRVLRTQGECGPRYPLFAAPAGGPWTTSRRGSWCAGAWIGLLRLAAARSGDTATARNALDRARSLQPWVTTDTVARAMVLHTATNSTDAHDEVACDPAVARLREDGARALTAAFCPALGAIPDGTALGRGELGARTCTVDATSSVIGLLHAAPQVPGAQQVAQRHARTLLGATTSDGRVHAEHRLRAEGTGPEPIGRAGAWARGQAWALLSAAGAVRAWGAPWLAPARAIAAHWTTLPVPPPDVAGEPDPVDTAAAAIAADALRLLATADLERSAAHRAAAQGLCAELARTHLTGSAPGLLPQAPRGVLAHACYRTGPRGREQLECVWGGYHLLRALCGTDVA